MDLLWRDHAKPASVPPLQITGLEAKGNVVDIIGLDFSKVVDTAPHVFHIGELATCGLDRITNRLMHNWLNNPKQRLTINGSMSD